MKRAGGLIGTGGRRFQGAAPLGSQSRAPGPLRRAPGKQKFQSPAGKLYFPADNGKIRIGAPITGGGENDPWT